MHLSKNKKNNSIITLWWDHYNIIRLKGIWYRDFLLLSNTLETRILDNMFFVKHTNWFDEEIRIIKTDFDLSSILLEIDFSTFLIFWFQLLRKLKYNNFEVLLFNMTFLGIRGDNIKKMGKSISSKLHYKFKSVFRILIAWLDQLVCLANHKSKILCHACVRQKQKITESNPLNNGIKSTFGFPIINHIGL